MQKISYPGCLGLSPAILSQFILSMCAAAKNCEKFTKISIWVAQGRLRVIDINKFKSLQPTVKIS